MTDQTPLGRLARTASGVLALQRMAGNSAVSWSLPRSTAWLVPVQRDALTPYKSTDPVAELRPVINAKNEDAWQLTLEGDFSTPDGVGRLVWPSRPSAPPGVSIRPTLTMTLGSAEEKAKPSTVHSRWVTFELSGLRPVHLKTMDPLFATLFSDLGLIEETAAIVAARDAFRSRHSDLGRTVLDNIDNALRRVTRNNQGLLESYYTFYADYKLTDDIDADSSTAGNTDSKIARAGGFTDLNVGVLKLMELPRLPTDNTLTLLGETLLHEYTHTAHASNILKGPGEGKAYGVENFFAERHGDETRDAETADLGPRMGDREAFAVSYFVMKRLYEVIDTGKSALPSLQGMTRQKARELAVEFIAKNKQEFSAELKNFILTEWNKSGYAALPSLETH